MGKVSEKPEELGGKVYEKQMGKVYEKPEELGGVRSGSTFRLLQLPVILALWEEQALHGAGGTFQGRGHF